MTTDDDPSVTPAPESADAEADAPQSAEAGADAPKGRVIRRGGRAPASDPPGGAGAARTTAEAPQAMIPARGSRPPVEAVLMRIIATAGIIGISVAIAAIMGSQHSQAWVIGLVTSVVAVVLAAVLWSSRRV